MPQTRPKIILHMGDAKTGTTSLQGILNAQSEALRAHGMVYARAGRKLDHAIGHHALPRSMWSCDTYTDLRSLPPWATLRAEIDALPEGMSLIVSSEGFSSLRTDWQARMLGEFFTGDEVRFLLAIRDPLDWVESMYSQTVKATPYITATFEQFQRNVTLKGICAALHLAEHFAPESFVVLPYGEDILARMLSALGLEDLAAGAAPDSARANVRDPEALLGALLALNRIEMPVRVRNRLYADLTRTCREHGTGRRGPETTPLAQVAFTPAQKTAFLERHAELIDRFCAIFGIARTQIVGT